MFEGSSGHASIYIFVLYLVLGVFFSFVCVCVVWGENGPSDTRY